MKAEPLKIDPDGSGYAVCDPSEATHIRLHFPGPFPNRILPIMVGGTRRGTPNWTWNGSVDSPTVRPSVLTQLENAGERKIVCHSWVNDGKVQFLSDSTHEFSGQTVDLLDID